MIVLNGCFILEIGIKMALPLNFRQSETDFRKTHILLFRSLLETTQSMLSLFAVNAQSKEVFSYHGLLHVIRLSSRIRSVNKLPKTINTAFKFY